MNVLNQTIGEHFALYNGDCVEVLKGIPDNSIHYSITSIPFASLYTYSNSERDMGNCRSYGEFAEQYQFLGREWFRVLMPGRLISIHCMNLPAMKERDGYIGMKDFRGDVIRWMEAAGFIYHAEVCIWKDPVVEMQRTKALGLLHKQIKKDSAMSRMGIPDYLVTFRKPGENPEQIAHSNETYPVGHWQQVASPAWKEYASPVWWDINQSATLNRNGAREEQDEKHICLAEGTLVLTKRGYVPIETVIPGDDEVLTNSGEWHKVVAKKMTRQNAQVVRTRAHGVPLLITTPDHKIMAKHNHGKGKPAFYTLNEEWTEARSLENCYVKSVTPPTIESGISEAEWWIIGRWLADGHIDARGHQYFISVGAAKWNEFAEKAKGFIGHTRKTGANCRQVGLVGLSENARAVLKKCGHGASEKKLPYECISLNAKLSSVLLEGYLSGDGHFMKDGKITASSVSRPLLLGIAIVAQKVHGRVASVYQGRPQRREAIEGRTVNCKQEWNLVVSPHYSFSEVTDERTAWKKVYEVLDAGKTDVWSIEVDEDHSYMAEGCIVKNCPLQLPVIERGIELWTNPGDIVLDPFDGIGSTGYQAIKMGRRHIGVELKGSYYAMAAANLERAEEEYKAAQNPDQTAMEL
jgi:DNA modification methylase